MKRATVFGALLLLLSCAVFGQSNEFVDNLLSKDAVSFGQISYLVLVASDNIGEDADEARAFELLENMGWAPRGATVSQTIRLDQYSLILMRAFGLKGGIMQGLLPSPRYAYRELTSIQVIQGRSDPGQKVSGLQAVQMLGRVFDVMGLNK